MHFKKMLVSAVAVTATVAIAGCGSATDTSSSSGATLTKANFASVMTKATSSIRSMHMTMDVKAQGKNVTMNADLAVGDPAAMRHMPVGEAMKHMSMAMKMDVPGGMGTVEMRLVDGVMYMNTGGLGSLGTSGKPWVKIDLNSPNNPMSSLFGSMRNLSMSQMARSFRNLVSLNQVGSDTVDGVAATHYKASIDTAKMVGLMGLGSQLSSASGLPKTLTYDVWLDAQNRPVEIATKMQQMDMAMHFSGWNEPVHIVAPPASQVSSLGA